MPPIRKEIHRAAPAASATTPKIEKIPAPIMPPIPIDMAAAKDICDSKVLRAMLYFNSSASYLSKLLKAQSGNPALYYDSPRIALNIKLTGAQDNQN